MPRFLLPRRSTPHRVAAIALYRALLVRCSSAPLPNELQSSLRNAIQNKFRKNRNLQGPYQLGLTFRAGYETLDHLDAASAGDASSIAFLLKLIPSLPRGIARLPPQPRLSPSPPDRSKKTLACLPPGQKELDAHPRKVLSGPRHVPILASANGLPFLRLKKPQPENLSRMLRQKLDSRMSLFDKKVLLLNYWAPIAINEDMWDEILRKECGIAESKASPKWLEAISEAKVENNKLHEKHMLADRELALRMQQIVDQETELALKEGQKIVRGRKRRPRSRHLFSYP
ncbi:hypothetical protein CC78DRAFT_531373 [Lojkania enalia]|uniref:Complex 1 LYR protein domain-containing protein n=1 Tax=Lojkania enalia TaxID=147567 RepID=A0A9P4KE08_9PLEO|nr:hypothetical protein CC78DRAFT_531373 [Didymosphaeria enalia]